MIYDCFPFFNELELLELRFETLNNVVDRFVLVEADQSHTGEPKPLFFAENRRRFQPYLDKIEHVVVHDLPRTDEPWERDRFQRNAVLRGLAHARSEDMILLSDVDEIPRPEAIRQLAGDGRCLRMLERDPIVLVQDLHYYYINCMDPAEPWYGTIAIRARNFTMIPDELRTLRFRLPRLRNGGWHFSYLGGVAKIIEKLHAKAEQDINSEENNDPDILRSNMTTGRSLVGGAMRHQFIFVRIDESYPLEMRNWLERYPAQNSIVPKDGWQSKPACRDGFLSHVGQWEAFRWRTRFNSRLNWD